MNGQESTARAANATTRAIRAEPPEPSIFGAWHAAGRGRGPDPARPGKDYQDRIGASVDISRFDLSRVPVELLARFRFAEVREWLRADPDVAAARADFLERLRAAGPRKRPAPIRAASRERRP